MSKLKLTYQGWSAKYHYFYCENLEATDEDADYCAHYVVRDDLAKKWDICTEYKEGIDFSIEVQMDEYELLIPYIDPSQLKLFDPCEL